MTRNTIAMKYLLYFLRVAVQPSLQCMTYSLSRRIICISFYKENQFNKESLCVESIFTDLHQSECWAATVWYMSTRAHRRYSKTSFEAVKKDWTLCTLIDQFIGTSPKSHLFTVSNAVSEYGPIWIHNMSTLVHSPISLFPQFCFHSNSQYCWNSEFFKFTTKLLEAGEYEIQFLAHHSCIVGGCWE